MKILVAGGTGLIGANVVGKLKEQGHEIVIGSPSKGVDIITGAGLSQALKDTEIVIDLSNSSSPEEENALAFFNAAGKNLTQAEQQAGIKHHVVLSIVGIDCVQHIGYLRAKKNQEDIIKNSGIPYTIIRSTQFHEHISTIIDVQGKDNNVYVSNLDFQPISADDVAEFVVKLALEPAKNQTIEIAGPEKASMDEFVSRYVKQTGLDKRVISDHDNKYMFYDFPKSGLVPQGAYEKGKISFNDWAKK